MLTAAVTQFVLSFYVGVSVLLCTSSYMFLPWTDGEKNFILKSWSSQKGSERSYDTMGNFLTSPHSKTRDSFLLFTYILEQYTMIVILQQNHQCQSALPSCRRWYSRQSSPLVCLCDFKLYMPEIKIGNTASANHPAWMSLIPLDKGLDQQHCLFLQYVSLYVDLFFKSTHQWNTL